MVIKVLPERRGLVEGPFFYPQWMRNYCQRCDLEIGAYYIVHQPYPSRRDLCLHCAEKQLTTHT